MSKLQTQIDSYVSSQGLRRQFMNFYRLVKTHSLLNSLFLSDSINRDTYNSQVKETIEKINILKDQLKSHDILRFCQLWGIQTQFKNLGKMNQLMRSDIKVGIGVARIANMLPMIGDQVASASTYGQIHEPFSKFCIQLTKMKESERNLSPAFKKTIDTLLQLQASLGNKYKRLNQTLSEDSRDELNESLTKFRVEYQKAENTLDGKKLTQELEKMTEWAKAVIFNEKQIIATKSCKPKFEQLTAYFKAYEGRDETIGRGFVLLGQHYDVHRYHPPLVYGRRGNAQNGEGISCAVGKSKKGEKVYILITYILPIISARAVPQQINFYNDFIGELEQFN